MWKNQGITTFSFSFAKPSQCSTEILCESLQSAAYETVFFESAYHDWFSLPAVCMFKFDNTLSRAFLQCHHAKPGQGND